FYVGSALSASFTLSLHDALPIYLRDIVATGGEHAAVGQEQRRRMVEPWRLRARHRGPALGRGVPHIRREHRGSVVIESRPAGTSDRKSTRLNSSHLGISYAVFCL